MHGSQGKKNTLSQEVEVLQTEIDMLQKLLGMDLSSIGILGRTSDEDPREIEARHIKLLHMYNESKDAAQVSQSTSTLHTTREK
ncbi:hypothetical protein FRC07_014998 [Ceratobasidium sp. 392]|nr:hypothetical protein FRC07_014998 [Ceratobasidium sp. 392]